MKKIIALLAIACFVTIPVSHAAVIEPAPVLPASFYSIPLRNFLLLTPRELNTMSGTKLTLQQKMSFGLLRSSMKKAVRHNPAITTGEYFALHKKMKTWLKVLLIIVGVFLLAFIIFAIAYGAGQE